MGVTGGALLCGEIVRVAWSWRATNRHLLPVGNLSEADMTLVIHPRLLVTLCIGLALSCMIVVLRGNAESTGPARGRSDSASPSSTTSAAPATLSRKVIRVPQESSRTYGMARISANKAFTALASVQLRNLGQKSSDFNRVQGYLRRFGYLGPEVFRPDVLDKPTARALTSFQTFNGLRPTGVFDSATRELMATFRCGVPDLNNGTAFVKQCPWMKEQFTYGFESAPQGPIDVSQFRAAVRTAFQTWAQVPNMALSFQEAPSENADIRIGWRTATDDDYGDMSRPETLAHADYPPGCRIISSPFPLTLPIHFKQDVKWSFGPIPDGFDIQSVALHEIGHVLGLNHSNLRDAVMRPYFIVGGDPRRQLFSDDVEGVQDLYHSAR